MVKSGYFLILILLIALLLSNTASADISKQALKCNSGTTIGNTNGDTTNFSCSSNGEPIVTGLLLYPSSSTTRYIKPSSNIGNVYRVYANFINNTVLTTDTNVTGYSASIYLRSSNKDITVYGKYELGYYDPDGASGNFVGLFNSTEGSTRSDSGERRSINFNGQYGTITAGKKLAVRVWIRPSSSSRPYFYAYSSTTYDSSFNVDLRPLGSPATYLLSGYVTNASSGAAISGATVSTNTSLTTTTNATGYYSFSLTNGTYLITASMVGYNANSITRNVNGGHVPNSNIALTPTPPSTGGKILVSTDRFVILDDDFRGTPESGFVSPAFGSGSGDPNGRNDAAKGKATTIGAYALFIDNNGLPLQGKNITFTFYRPAAYGVYQTKYGLTDSNGVARAFSNLDNTFYYGRWKVKAESSSLSATSNFIYNWWGCNYNSGSCDKDHEGKDWPTGATINSPYMDGYDKVVGKEGDHYEKLNGVCTGCHRSYDSTNGTPNTNYPSTPSTIQIGIHNGIRCDNSSCHGSIDAHRTNIAIGSCYGASGCHPFRTDISGKSTLNGVVSAYSNSTTGTYNKYHTPDSTVLCIICHGPVHNTTKPDESQKFIKNTVTENSHCWSCHTKREIVHYGENCVSCHYQDAHKIAAGEGPNCISCHDNTGSAIHRVDVSSINSGIHANLNSAAFNGTGIPAANKKCWGCHQSDGKQPTGMGDKYKNPYSCLDCHGNISKPSYASSALNATEHYKNGTDVKAVIFAANDLSSCLFCHNKSELKVSYTEVDTLWSNVSLVSHYGKKRTDLIDANGTKCAYCHVKPAHVNFTDAFVDISNMNITHNGGNPCSDCHNKGRLHNESLVGGGGPDCISCHSGSGRAKVDIQAMNDSAYVHFNLNNNSNTGSLNIINRICWGCHTNDTVSADKRVDITELPQNGHPNAVKTPKTCKNCHTGSVKFNAQLISEHNPDASQVKTTYTCVQCHNNSIKTFQDTQTNLTSNTNILNPDFNIGRVSHYADASQLQSGGTGSIYCLNCHNNSVTALKYGIRGTVDIHGIVECYVCHTKISSPTTKLHENNLKKEKAYYNSDTSYYCFYCHPPVSLVGAHGTLANPMNCLNCHMNNTTSVVTKKTVVPGTRNTNTIFHTNGSRANGYPKALVPGDLSLVRGTLAYQRSQCTICHDGAVNHNPGYVCSSCHASQNSHPTWHSTNVSGGGGPGCLSCHDSSGPADHRVDGSAMSSGMHKNLNPKTSADPNSKCWGCHQSDGNQPSGMGDIFDKPYKCIDCHTSSGQKNGSYGAFIVDEHYPSGKDIIVLATRNNLEACIICHNKTEMKVDYVNPNNLYSNYSLVSHYGKARTEIHTTNETNCAYCHKNQSNFTDTFQKSSNTQIIHDNDKSCYLCHRSVGSLDGRIHDSSLVGGSGGSCTQCHGAAGSATVVSTDDLGKHINLNTTDGGGDNLTNADCVTCHFDSPHKGTNPTNTYFCADCHTTAGTGPKISSINFTDKLHGENTCTDCHIADGKYHQGNPRGSVANLTYINRYPTANRNATDCADCHFAANLDDAPFNAPGGGSHIQYSIGGACITGCHAYVNNTIQTVHKVGAFDLFSCTVSTPNLSSSDVIREIDVSVTAWVEYTGIFAVVDGAQYRIMLDATEVRSWTAMSALDGDFNGTSELATAVIKTNITPGTYTVEVRGMAGGLAQNASIRYYPINGDVSATKSTTLTVRN